VLGNVAFAVARAGGSVGKCVRYSVFIVWKPAASAMKTRDETTSARLMPAASRIAAAIVMTVLVCTVMSPVTLVLSTPFRLTSPARNKVLPVLMP